MFAERIRTDVSFKNGKFRLKINRRSRNANNIALLLFSYFRLFSTIGLIIKVKTCHPKSKVKQEYNLPLSKNNSITQQNSKNKPFLSNCY